MQSLLIRGLLVGFSLLPLGVSEAAASVSVEFSAQGLSSLKMGGQEWLMSGAPTIPRALGADGKPVGGKMSGSTFDASTKTLTNQYPWGTLTCAYEAVSDGVRIRVRLQNSGTQAVKGLTLSVLSLKPLGEGKVQPPVYCVEEPTFAFFKGAEATSVLGAENQTWPLSLDFAVDQKTGSVSPRAGFGGGRVILDDVQLSETLEPGKTMEFTLVVRLGPSGTDPMVLASDFLDAFRKANPSILDWPDRRPIYRAFFGGGLPTNEAANNLKNPESAVAPAADEKFRENLMKKIAGIIQAAKSVDAQGVILWDLEGDKFPHAITYIGDPRHIRLLNPQMDLFIDEAVKKLTEAGLRTGITLRPSRVIYDAEKHWAKHSHTDAKDPFTELDGKIAYAKQRWGCTIFYVDTNYFWRPYGPEKKFESGRLKAELWRRLRTKYPDTLFIPEFASEGDYASVAGYGEADMGNYGVPPIAKALYPDAFRVIVIEDADPSDNFDRFISALEGKNVLMTYGQGLGHFNSEMIARMQAWLELKSKPVPEAVAKATPAQLADLLTSSDPATAFHAALKLKETPSEDAAAKLLEVAQGEGVSWPVRRAAVVALGAVPYSQAIPYLFELTTDRKLGLYGDAAKSLVIQESSVDDLAMEKLRELTAGKSTFNTFEQVGTILVLRKASAKAKGVEEIYSTLTEKDTQARRALLDLIGELRNPDSEAFLLPILEDPQMGPTAGAALVRIGSKHGVEQVKAAAEAAKKAGNKELAGAYGRALQVK